MAVSDVGRSPKLAMSLGLPTPITSQPPTPEVTSPKRDNEFYCEDIVFLVETTLFKVSRRPFEGSGSAFSDAFTLPPIHHPAGKEGSSDAHPLFLESIKEDEFRAFLRVLFPSHSATHKLTKFGWLSVLKLSDMWDFESQRKQAIAELSNIIYDPVERIALARRFRIPDWMAAALLSLAQQETITASELEQLGWDMAAKLYVVRDSAVFRDKCTCGCGYCRGNHGELVFGRHPQYAGEREGCVTIASLRRSFDFLPKIREVFGSEIL